MEPSTEWKEREIKELIENRVKESLSLEYKACDALKSDERSKIEISKDVSAFANSAGGIIVYGVKEKEHLPVVLDGGYDPKKISREWIEQIINSRIQRRIDGVYINQVELEESSPGRVAYVVTIPQSLRAPHMAADNKFYKRFNFQSLPMEEYEVRDVVRRSEAPDLYLDVRLEKGERTGLVECKAGKEFCEPVSLGLGIGNYAPQPAEYAVVRILLDSRLQTTDAAGLGVVRDAALLVGDKKILVSILTMNWSIPSKLPIFEGVDFNLVDRNSLVQIAFPSVPDSYFLGWEILAPRMLPKRQFYDLIFKEGVVSLKQI